LRATSGCAPSSRMASAFQELLVATYQFSSLTGFS
jgi:hypothetical protein